MVSSLQSLLVNQASTKAGYALQYRYSQKWDKYGPPCQAEGMVFQPVPIKVLGGWHDAGVRLVKQIGHAMARLTGQDNSVVTQHLFGKLSVLLMRDTAQLVLNRMPQSEPSTDGIL